ncbi:thiol-disulfide oxidoreductase DCC family protein [Bacillus suaedaesalsae]|uniref:Thiol-disulfide oxidoreductase DCC family protein n=1 Tax=Bacillus suaedaesalsae TaxID=2810349 RepID=A0ABS2DEH7_9BACI|nr:thiol-disulfide oxidoreductase DCC family protein [Bacillus suaedaesalsae]MBM6616831.1 thiol-disulfide oxidoreductase DCC family protein [Bacillus suaedaesalsae]
MNHPLVLFDGVCNLCNGAVQFLIKHDKKEKLTFASLQSESGQKVLSEFGFPTDQLNSFIYVSNQRAYEKSDAALAICRELGGIFTLCTVFYIIPRKLRDKLYSWVSRNRYKWFGKQEQCVLPTPELRKRFLK